MTDEIAETTPPTLKTKGRSRPFRLIQELCVAMVLIGSFGTWAIYEVKDQKGHVSQIVLGGTDSNLFGSNGWVTFTFAMVILVFFFLNVLMNVKATAGMTTGLFLAIATVGGSGAFPIWSIRAGAPVPGQVGWGLMLVLIGGFVGMIMGFVWLFRSGQIGAKDPDFS